MAVLGILLLWILGAIGIIFVVGVLMEAGGALEKRPPEK
jgi:hypothetical protein